MIRRTLACLSLALAGSLLLPAWDDEPNITFKSDVALIRVDVQVVDRDNRAITHLRAEDFILTDQGRRQEIRNFASENMPLDILLLLDVSASMRPHVQRIADASHEALRVLGPNDRVGIMVFDTTTRTQMPFRSGASTISSGLERVLDRENFRGGTHITRGMLDAVSYMQREARKDARRAIIILTDDMTQDARDEAAVNSALTRSNTVMCALIAPDAMDQAGRRGGYGGNRGGGGGYPGGGGGGIGGLGGIILGQPRGGMGGGGMGRGRGQGGYGGDRNHSAGTREIARSSGGDDLSVDDANALEDTLSRLRQRYALYFYAPADSHAGQERSIDVALNTTAARRYSDAEVRFRRVYLATGGSGGSSNDEAPIITRNPSRNSSSSRSSNTIDTSDVPSSRGSYDDNSNNNRPITRRRPMVDGSGSRSDGPLVSQPTADSNAQDSPSSSSAPAAPTTVPTDNTKSGGWKRVTPGQQP